LPVRLVPDRRGYIYVAIQGLLAEGWDLVSIPKGGRLRANQQLLTLHYLGTTKRYRLLIFKSGRSGRNRPTERRIEATSTYVGGRVVPIAQTEDVLLGFDEEFQVFIGFDPRRLHHGGSTQNASSFFDIAELARASVHGLHVVPRESDLFGVEYHAFIQPRRIAEYLVNMTLIHRGVYTGGGQFSQRQRTRRVTSSRESVPDARAAGQDVQLQAQSSVLTNAQATVAADRRIDLEIIETSGIAGLRRRRLSSTELEDLLRQARMNGLLGEQIVLEDERRRLRAAHRSDLASQVEWVSQDDVGAGFDIASFETDGTPRIIEVKATSGTSKRFLISRNEWRTAERKRASYWIYLVTSVSSSPAIHRYQDPVDMVRAGTLVREESEWVVTVP
jgi:Protein NO VEIN, C-terminal/Methylase-associated X1